MVDLDTALEEVRRFATRPPGPRSPLEQLDERARNRRRKRQVVRGACAGLIVLVGAAGLRAAVTDDEPADLRTVEDGPPPTDAPTSPSDQLQVEPATDLESGQVVTITLPEAPADDAIIAQCASEAAEATDPVPWCDLGLVYARTADGAGHFQVTVLRTIQTSEGIIDCVERPERCVIGVRSGGRDFIGAISFREVLGPVAAPTLSVDRSMVVDGDQVTITGAGFTPGAEVYISQCRLPSEAVDQMEGSDFAGCDAPRALRLTAGASGQFERQLLVHREVFPDYLGWFECEPCVLQATAMRQEPATVSIQVAPGQTSNRPTVRIVPDGPYQRNQRVQLRGSGFQGVADVLIGWCRFNTEDPASEARGAGPDFATCDYPVTGLQPDEEGNFVVDDFPMPSESFGLGATCEDPAARCGLAWHPSEEGYPVFITFFEMVPGQ